MCRYAASNETDAPRTVSSSASSPADVLAIARWEDNTRPWLEGEFYGLASKSVRLQERVGRGGTLWVVVSRRGPAGRRSYSLAYRLVGCQPKLYRDSKWPYAVVGDADRSRLFASNDARLLLMSLRFDPFAPIKSAGLIGQSIQYPRRLSADDVTLLNDHGLAANRWSVFVSYDRRDNLSRARRLSDSLARRGMNVFRDQEGLRTGQHFPPALAHAIAGARHFVLLIGPHTHESGWVKEELTLARTNRKCTINPVLAGGDLTSWEHEFPGLSTLHAREYADPSWGKFVELMVRDLRASGR